MDAGELLSAGTLRIGAALGLLSWRGSLKAHLFTPRARSIAEELKEPVMEISGINETSGGPSSDRDTLQKRLPANSVYLWAAGLDGADASSAIVGWIVLLVQIISYTVLLVKSPKRGIDNVCQASVTFQPVEGTLCDIDTKNGSVPVEAMYDGAEAVYTISSIAVANLLVVVFAAGDLRGAIALLRTWTSRNVALGLGILASFVLLVLSSASVLFFVSNDDVSFIVGAAAVLFISDLDEKSWVVLRTLNGSSRIFWCIEAVSLSFVGAFLAITWVGHPSATASIGANTTLNDNLLAGDLLFWWPFLAFVAPTGATVVSWEVAFLLQWLAERYGDNEGEKQSKNLHIFVAMEMYTVVAIIAFVTFRTLTIVGVGMPRWLECAMAFFMFLYPATFGVIAAAALILPCGTRWLSCSKLTMLIALGIGHFAVFWLYVVQAFSDLLTGNEFAYLALNNGHNPNLLKVFNEYIVFLAVMILVMLVMAIRGTFHSQHLEIKALSWAPVCCRCSCPPQICDQGGESSLFGCLFVALSLYIKLYCAALFVANLTRGDVKF